MEFLHEARGGHTNQNTEDDSENQLLSNENHDFAGGSISTLNHGHDDDSQHIGEGVIGAAFDF